MGNPPVILFLFQYKPQLSPQPSNPTHPGSCHPCLVHADPPSGDRSALMPAHLFLGPGCSSAWNTIPWHLPVSSFISILLLLLRSCLSGDLPCPLCFSVATPPPPCTTSQSRSALLPHSVSHLRLGVIYSCVFLFIAFASPSTPTGVSAIRTGCFVLFLIYPGLWRAAWLIVDDQQICVD